MRVVMLIHVFRNVMNYWPMLARAQLTQLIFTADRIESRASEYICETKTAIATPKNSVNMAK